MKFDFNSLPATSPNDAKALVLGGSTPEALRVNGALELALSNASASLPAWRVWQKPKHEPPIKALPKYLKARRVDVSHCPDIHIWPEVMECGEFKAQNTSLQCVPEGWSMEFRLDLAECLTLRHLPHGLRTGSLVLSGCTSLETLPDDLSVYFLDLSGCTGLRSLPQRGEIRMGNLNLSGCIQLESLPAWLGTLSQLDVSGCSLLRSLPEGLCVTSWLEVADSGLTELPLSLRDAPLRFRGVPVSYREVFERESLTPFEVMGETNAERRRVLLELLGYERFIAEANAQTLDADTDPGGERRLLKVELQDDEPLVVLAVFCPSTGHQYTLRVPPQTPTCRHAAAWIAGFDNPNDYAPLKET
ncbi:hypothetical protein EON83_02065 [bacterium]|nr:MAG: hypothetical protein EON83_02065 [bacterium]